MDFLTVKEMADLKGCSVQYIKKLAHDGKIQTVQEINMQNNCMQYMIPVAALPEELKQKYYSGLNITVSPAAECMPAVMESRIKPAPKKTGRPKKTAEKPAAVTEAEKPESPAAKTEAKAAEKPAPEKASAKTETKTADKAKSDKSEK